MLTTTINLPARELPVTVASACILTRTCVLKYNIIYNTSQRSVGFPEISKLTYTKQVAYNEAFSFAKYNSIVFWEC